MIIAKGCIVPIRCIISIGVEDDITPTDPLAPLSDIEVMFMEKASIQSAGESPMFTWTAVFAAGVGFVPVPDVEVLPPPLHAVRDVRNSMRQAITAAATAAYEGLF